MNQHLQTLQKFRESLYLLFPKRKDAIMNLLDALTAHGNQYKSVVQLCTSPYFLRQYSSITDAVADGLPSAQWKTIRKLVFNQNESCGAPPVFLLDCTPNPRPYAKTLSDKHITHAPNPAPGNKPICVGHQYSALAMLPNNSEAQTKHWLVPISARRVPSKQKGNEFGMQQLTEALNELDIDASLAISVGDSLYATEACRKTASQNENLVHITRLNQKRNVYAMPSLEEAAESKRRPKEFGDKMKLNDPSAPHKQEQVSWVSAKGKQLTADINTWNQMLLRGSRGFKASKHPFTLIQIQVKDQNEKTVFKRPLWLGVFGSRKEEISSVQAYQHYTSRYDIEHFFRFGKRNLMMDAHQTPDVKHEEDWWQLCLVAYAQLYLAKESTATTPQPWERYLPEYKDDQAQSSMHSPSQTQRGFSNVLEHIGTPAKPNAPRGDPRGRMLGEDQAKREVQPVIFKSKKQKELDKKSIIEGSELDADLSNTKKINALLKDVEKKLTKLEITPEDFLKMLIDSS